MCGLPKVGRFFSLAALFLFSPVSGWAQSAEDTSPEVQLQAIESRLSRLEAGTQKILANQEKIMAELDRIRIWTRRR